MSERLSRRASGARERANGKTSGTVLASRFLALLNHRGLLGGCMETGSLIVQWIKWWQAFMLDSVSHHFLFPPELQSKLSKLCGAVAVNE